MSFSLWHGLRYLSGFSRLMVWATLMRKVQISSLWHSCKILYWTFPAEVMDTATLQSALLRRTIIHCWSKLLVWEIPKIRLKIYDLWHSCTIIYSNFLTASMKMEILKSFLLCALLLWYCLNQVIWQGIKQEVYWVELMEVLCVKMLLRLALLPISVQNKVETTITSPGK